MKKALFISSFLVFALLITIVSATAFNFYGYTYDTNKDALNSTNVTVEVYQMQPGSPLLLNSSYSVLSNASGWFNLSVDTENSDYLYKPIIRHFNGTNADYIGQSLPEFPFFEVQNLGLINFYLKQGATINITAVGDNGTIGFFYMIKDQKLGYSVSEYFSENQNASINQTTVYVPADRNYSIMIYPDDSFPVSYDLNNISDYSSPKHVDIEFNTSDLPRRVTGYADYSGSAGFDELNLIAYLVEPGDMLFQDWPLPYNLSAWDGSSDIYNATSGYFNITLPGAAMGADIMVLAVAKNGSDYYGALRNITLDYSSTPVTGFNFSLQQMLGTASTVTIDDANGGTVNITVPKVTFQLKNSSGSNLSDSAFVEAEIDYSSLYTNGPSFSWMEDIGPEDSGQFSLILMSGAGISELNMFLPSFAPLSTDFSASELTSSPVNIQLENFNPGAIDSEDAFSDLYIDLLKSTDACNVPYPADNCSLTPGNETILEDFNPLSVIIGGGDISFRMRRNTNNITVHYSDVDLLASGPPDALFDPESNSSSSGTGLEQAWRFGSKGPEIYSEVLIGIPYASTVDESAPIKILLDKLYDNDWSIIWSITSNGTPSSSADLPVKYQDFDLQWFNSTSGGKQCSLTNTSADCYVNTTTNTAWIRIPHFSGIGPSVSSVTKGNVTLNASSSSYECRENCTVYINVTNNNYTISQSLRNITINNSETTGNVNEFNISLYNGSAFVYNGTNSTTHTNYNLTLYNGSSDTVHRYKIDISKNNNSATTWTFSYQIDSLDAIELNISLTCTESWSCTDWSTCSSGTQTRTCTDSNSCGTETNKPSESQSCSSGSSGGGGSGIVPSTKTWNTANSATYQMRTVDTVKFKVNEEDHSARVHQIGDDYVTMKFSSDSVMFDLFIGQTKKVDVNTDSIYDVIVTLNSIANSKADITFTATSEEYTPQENADIPEVTAVEQLETVQEPVEPSAEQPPSEVEVTPPATQPEKSYALVYIVVALVIIASVILVVLRTAKKHK